MLSTPEMMTASRLTVNPRYIHLENVQSTVSSPFRIGASVQGRGYTGYLGWVSMNNLASSPLNLFAKVQKKMGGEGDLPYIYYHIRTVPNGNTTKCPRRQGGAGMGGNWILHELCYPMHGGEGKGEGRRGEGEGGFLLHVCPNPK